MTEYERIRPITLLQIVYKMIFNFQVIVEIILDPNHNFKRNSEALSD